MNLNSRWSVLLLSLLSGVVFVIVYIHLRTFSTGSDFNLKISPDGSSNLQKGKSFIYLIQAESCLSQHIASYFKRGNNFERDVLVLSWKTSCDDSSRNLSNVIYIFNPATTWSSGRNLLYRLAINRNHKYLYYIFLDEDIEFSFTFNTTRDIYSKGTEHPLTAFENFLHGYEPAVGLCNYCSRCGKLLGNGSYVPALCCSPRTTSGKLPPIFPATISFDAAINAFHAKAVKNLLPYRLDYEATSWWESQKYVILASDVMFRGQVVRYTLVTAINSEHRDYPQQQLDNWASVLEDVRIGVPERYKNQSVFNLEPVAVNMDAEIDGNFLRTQRWSIPIPAPKTTIKPYSHFDKYKYD